MRWARARLVAIGAAAIVGLCAAPSATASEEVRASANPDAVAQPVDPGAPSDARKKAKKKRKRKKEAVAPSSTAGAPSADAAASASPVTAVSTALPITVPITATIGAGAFTGERTLHLPGAFATSSVEATPTARVGPVEIELPLFASHREPFANPLRQTELGASLAVDVEPLQRFHLAGEAGVALTERPAWPDLLQPTGGAEGPLYLPTDRFSHVDVFLRGKVQAVPLRHHHARLKVAFVRRDYPQDPAFDAFVRPNHLTPDDRDELSAEGSWRYIDGPIRLGVAVGAARINWFFLFARDAKTGATHAGAGGDPPNPLQIVHVYDVEPSADLVLIKDRLALGVDWRVRATDDIYAGYYSALESRFGPSIDATVGPANLDVRIEGRFSGMMRIYTASGYGAGPSHPPLDDGTVRDDHAAQWDLQVRFPARAQLALVLDASARLRRTNFPDYQTGVFPASQAYDVDWDYQQARVMVGIELKLDPAAAN